MNNTFLALVVVVGDLPCSRTWHTSGRPLADFWQTSIGGVLPHAPTHPPADLRQTSIGGVLPHAPTPLGRPPADLRQTSGRPPADLQQTSSRYVHLEHSTTSAAPGGSSPSSSGMFLSHYRTFVVVCIFKFVVRTHQFCSVYRQSIVLLRTGFEPRSFNFFVDSFRGF